MASLVSISNHKLLMKTKLHRHLAQDELETITVDKWDEEIWGVEEKDAADQKSIPKLIFYFAKEVCFLSKSVDCY